MRRNVHGLEGSGGHFAGRAIPLTIRYSDAAPNPNITDSSPDLPPHGMAIRFKLPAKENMDIVAVAHNGFVVGTGEDFWALEKGVVATDPSKPHPWPVEVFLDSHGEFRNGGILREQSVRVCEQGRVKQAARCQILPVAGTQY